MAMGPYLSRVLVTRIHRGDACRGNSNVGAKNERLEDRLPRVDRSGEPVARGPLVISWGDDRNLKHLEVNFRKGKYSGLCF